jgi:hypothetical protein
MKMSLCSSRLQTSHYIYTRITITRDMYLLYKLQQNIGLLSIDNIILSIWGLLEISISNILNFFSILSRLEIREMPMVTASANDLQIARCKPLLHLSWPARQAQRLMCRAEWLMWPLYSIYGALPFTMHNTNYKVQDDGVAPGTWWR